MAEVPPLGRNETHVWIALLDRVRGPVPGSEDALTTEELERAARYRHPRARDQFIAVRGLLRALLARYLGSPPAEIAVAPRADGKPGLAGRHAGALEFNLSHTDGLALFAVGLQPVGVDVERERAITSADGLVERFFSPTERDQYRGLPVGLRPTAFFRGWVCKEAVLKGIGCGARELDRCIVDLDPRGAARIVGPEETRRGWALACWEPAGGCVAAVAVARIDERELVLE